MAEIRLVGGQLNADEYKSIVEEQDRLLEKSLEIILTQFVDDDTDNGMNEVWLEFLSKSSSEFVVATGQLRPEWNDHEIIKTRMTNIEKVFLNEINAFQNKRHLRLIRMIRKMNEIITGLEMISKENDHKDDDWYKFNFD